MIWKTACCWMIGASTGLACDIALMLTVDVSGSIDAREYRLQMDGMAAALEDSSIADALVAAKAKVSVVQWSGSSRQEISVDWRQMNTLSDVEILVRDVKKLKRPWRHFSTAIGDMLIQVGPMFDGVGCKQSVIDVSGDGISNEGHAPDEPRDALVVKGIRINALAILGATDQDLTQYYRKHVIGGLNSFVYEAANYEDYPETIRRKLLDEITEPVS